METCLEFEEGSGDRVEWERADMEVGTGGEGDGLLRGGSYSWTISLLAYYNQSPKGSLETILSAPKLFNNASK